MDNIPKEVENLVFKLKEEGFQALPVGGSVRDLLLGKKPRDWDVATDAKPEEIQNIFPESIYENEFGTVAVKTGSENENLKLVEITTFRTEKGYSDKRHPDEVIFSESIKEDLKRRDFTINAIALQIEEGELSLIDPFGGKDDLEREVVRTVGDPEERFGEDALRMMRAVRFATELDFEIEKKTSRAIQKNNNLLGEIAEERIRDELVKIIKSSRADMGIRLLEKVGLLEYIIPELREGIECYQSGHHIYTVWEHNIRSLKYAAENNYPLRTRMAALLHDVGKPRTKEGKGEEATYYNHEVIGAEMTSDILERLKFPNDFVDTVSHLVRYHLFYYEIGEVTEAGIRRFLKRVGPENVEDLIDLRKADRIGSGVPKAVPYRLRHFLFMIDKVKRDPISVDMLDIDGDDVMEYGGIEPGPEVGYILKVLLDEVIEDPEKNNEAFLKERVKDLAELDEKNLKRRAKEAQKKVEAIEEKEIENLKEKHHVK